MVVALTNYCRNSRRCSAGTSIQVDRKQRRSANRVACKLCLSTTTSNRRTRLFASSTYACGVSASRQRRQRSKPGCSPSTRHIRGSDLRIDARLPHARQPDSAIACGETRSWHVGQTVIFSAKTGRSVTGQSSVSSRDICRPRHAASNQLTPQHPSIGLLTRGYFLGSDNAAVVGGGQMKRRLTRMRANPCCAFNGWPNRQTAVRQIRCRL